MKSNIPKCGLAVLTALMLASCGDDGGSENNGPSTADQIVASYDDLTLCTAKREGTTAYVKDEKTVYVCENGNWNPEREKSSSVASSSASGDDFCRNGVFTDARDGKSYKCATIGDQTWMAENLNYEYNVNGVTYGNWCYNDSVKYCTQYGRLYAWGVAMDSATTGCGYGKICTVPNERIQGICPLGWHLPNQTEWNVLFMAVGGSHIAGRMLKTTEGWKTNGNGNNAYGFSALPSGFRQFDGYFFGADADNGSLVSYYWSSFEDGQDNAYRMNLLEDAETSTYYCDKRNAISVRCIKD